MKKFRKLLAFGLALIMCLGMAVTASAGNASPLPDAPAKGTITIKNATVGKDYTAYKIFEANPSGGTNVAYTATAEQFAVLTNDTYKDANPFELIANTDGSYNVSMKTGKEDVQNVVNFFNPNGVLNEALLRELGATEVVQEKVQTTTVEFKNLDFGYYIITSSVGTAVTLTSTNYNATVIDKNQSEPGWKPDPEDPKKNQGKVIVTKDASGNVTGTEKENSVNYGDTVDFRISIKTTNYVGKEVVDSYIITDTLDEGMSYVLTNGAAKDIKVKVGDTLLTAIEEGKPEQGQCLIEVTGNTFKITVPWATFELGENNEIDPDRTTCFYGAGSDLTVEYAATVDTDAAVGQALKNTAKFQYTKNGGTPTDGPDEEKTETYTYSFDLVKTDEAKALLTGAKFNLYTQAQDGTPVALVKEGDVYRVAAKGEQGTTTDIEAGKVTIKGLKAGEYWLAETEAPNGYNILDLRKSFEITKDTNNLDATMSSDTEYSEGGVQVINKAGSLLPSTGGIGTTIFYVVGGLLVAGAGVLLITKKRMKREQ